MYIGYSSPRCRVSRHSFIFQRRTYKHTPNSPPDCLTAWLGLYEYCIQTSKLTNWQTNQHTERPITTNDNTSNNNNNRLNSNNDNNNHSDNSHSNSKSSSSNRVAGSIDSAAQRVYIALWQRQTANGKRQRQYDSPPGSEYNISSVVIQYAVVWLCEKTIKTFRLRWCAFSLLRQKREVGKFKNRNWN